MKYKDNICKTCLLRYIDCTTMSKNKKKCESYIKEVPYYEWAIVWDLE